MSAGHSRSIHACDDVLSMSPSLPWHLSIEQYMPAIHMLLHGTLGLVPAGKLVTTTHALAVLYCGMVGKINVKTHGCSKKS